MTNKLNGMHLSNAGQYDIEQMLRIASGAVTCMHFQLVPKDTMSDNTGDNENEYFYGKMRHGWPPQGIPPSDRLIHIRLYQAKWTDWDPREVARRAVALLSNWRSAGRDGHPVLTADLLMDPRVLLSPCNEQNLEGDWPPGGWWGMTETERAEILRREAQWQLDFWSEMDRLRPDRRCLSMLGALAFGGDWLNDVPDSEYTHPVWRKLLAYVDVLATHPYANFSPTGPGPTSADIAGDGYWHLYRDFRPKGWRDSRQPGHKPDIGGILAQVPNKPLFISETGTFVHGDNWRNAETEQAFRTLYSLAQQSGRVLGVTPFIWNADAGHAGNRIWPNVDLRARLEGMPGYVTTCKVPVRGAVTPVPPPAPPPIIVPPVLTVRPAVEVLRGDGWWSIARRCYGATTAAQVAALRKANGDPALAAGMRLWVPGWRAVRE